LRIVVTAMNKKTNERSIEQGRKRGGIPRREDLWLFFCEGEKTEPNYIRALFNAHPGAKKPTIEIAVGKGTNEVLVNYATKQIAQRNGRNPSKIFIVFDNDAEGSEQLFSKAVEECYHQEYIPLWSNVCFEVWLLLHFQDCKAAIHPGDYCDKLSELLKKYKVAEKYNKTDVQIYAHINSHGSETCAIRRSKTLLESHKQKKGYDQWNPSTNMQELLGCLKDYSKK
jgi:hypothetical protein